MITMKYNRKMVVISFSRYQELIKKKGMDKTETINIQHSHSGEQPQLHQISSRDKNSRDSAAGIQQHPDTPVPPTVPQPLPSSKANRDDASVTDDDDDDDDHALPQPPSEFFRTYLSRKGLKRQIVKIREKKFEEKYPYSKSKWMTLK